MSQRIYAGHGWTNQPGAGYEVSSRGDRRFSALYARLPDGRTIEDAWGQAKGYADGRAAKGRPALTPDFDYWATYKGLWSQWANANPGLMQELAVASQGQPLVDRFARTENNQARALAELLAEAPAVATPKQARIYAGIGSRSTPPEVLAVMQQLAARMEQQGWLLRSGGARGADSAFEAGVSNPRHRSIYLPGRSFNGRVAGPGGYVDATQMPGWTGALQSVAQYHPAPDRLSPFARNLMARNAMQVLGPSLDRPADLIVAWTPGGMIAGGTGQALRMAQDHGIEIRNLGRPAVMAKAQRWLGLA